MTVGYIPFMNSSEINIEDFIRFVKYDIMPSSEYDGSLVLEPPVEYFKANRLIPFAGY